MTTQAAKVEPAPPELSWRKVWHVPVLAAAGVVLAAGLVTAVMHRPKPNYDDAFARSEALAKGEKYGEAIDALNRDVGAHFGALSTKQVQKFYTLLGRNLALGQQQLHLDRDENNKAIVEQYAEAEKNGAALEPNDVRLLGGALISLGDVEAAVQRAEKLREAAPQVRVEMFQRLIERALATRGGRPGAGQAIALELIGRLAADPDLPESARMWTTARQAEVLLGQNLATQAEKRLQQTLLRSTGLHGRELGELLVLLAQAYLDEGNLAGAKRQLDLASSQIGEGDPLQARLVLMQARAEWNAGDAARAKERYEAALARFGDWSIAPEVLWGLARVEAQLDQHEDACKHFEHLVAMVRGAEAGPGHDVEPHEVGEALVGLSRDRLQAGDLETALRYATIADSGAGEDKDASTLMALAKAHEALGDQAISNAGGDNALTLAQLDPATAAVAREHFMRAGAAYRAHAQSVVVDNNDAYGSSLWAAGSMFDRAGDLESSVEAFKLFADGFPGDPRVPEAKFRLAQAHFAMGDLGSAEKLFRELIDGRSGTEGTGSFADASIVPLARTLLSDNDAGNDAEAERWLTRAVSGEFGGPGTPNYRAALDELALLYYRAGRYPEAIARLGEHIERYASLKDPALDMVRYRLGDSRRLLAAQIASELDREKMPDEERRAKRLKRTDLLRKAAEDFLGAREALDGRAHRSPLEDTCLRNTFFYLGECSFGLGQYEGAIREYAAAKERYPRDPASLVAMVQIVACYRAMGETDKARTANARARAFFESLPEEVWNDPALPMDREAWRVWLDSTLELERTASGSGGEPGGTP